MSKARNHKAVKCLFKKFSQSFHVLKPRVITVDKNPAYPIAIEQLKKEKRIPIGTKIRRIKYLNNIEDMRGKRILDGITPISGYGS